MKSNTMPPVEPMTRTLRSGPDAEPYPVQAHHLLCAACVRGGCKNPPCGPAMIEKLLDVLWSYPHVPLRICADTEVVRVHYRKLYEKRGGRFFPRDFKERKDAFAERRKDLEVCRLLGIYPNTVLPAYHAYQILFSRLRTLEGMCRGLSGDTSVWPECPCSGEGFYERIAGTAREISYEEQWKRGEQLAGEGIWAIIRPRTHAEMKGEKERSAAFIINKAGRLYIRPNHLLCILCTRKMEVLVQDNLVELRMRMEADPDIPVTLVEGCCMVCDPCNVYHAGEHLCYSTHPKNILRDLRMLEILGLPPGATLPARRLYKLIFDKIPDVKTVCGWGDGSNTSPFWKPCADYQSAAVKDARKEGFLQSG
ncbi:MAG: hypothetical protein JW957_00630 [Candidatus Omnitrophica bacterium]|nr:hypothetical protein [Candidatus Omnitrophota bacterium]